MLRFNKWKSYFTTTVISPRPLQQQNFANEKCWKQCQLVALIFLTLFPRWANWAYINFENIYRHIFIVACGLNDVTSPREIFMFISAKKMLFSSSKENINFVGYKQKMEKGPQKIQSILIDSDKERQKFVCVLVRDLVVVEHV